jgi:hypothetical protein
MYDYTDFDRAFVRERVAEFREQVERRIEGKLTEDEFLPLRLRNGLYLQLHAYMLRIAIPYGTLDSRKMRQLAMIAGRWDKGYGHFTTRQNIQFNWPKLRDVPDILEALAEVEDLARGLLRVALPQAPGQHVPVDADVFSGRCLRQHMRALQPAEAYGGGRLQLGGGIKFRLHILADRVAARRRLGDGRFSVQEPREVEPGRHVITHAEHRPV